MAAGNSEEVGPYRVSMPSSIGASYRQHREKGTFDKMEVRAEEHDPILFGIKDDEWYIIGMWGGAEKMKMSEVCSIAVNNMRYYNHIIKV